MNAIVGVWRQIGPGDSGETAIFFVDIEHGFRLLLMTSRARFIPGYVSSLLVYLTAFTHDKLVAFSHIRHTFGPGPALHRVLDTGSSIPRHASTPLPAQQPE